MSQRIGKTKSSSGGGVEGGWGLGAKRGGMEGPRRLGIRRPLERLRALLAAAGFTYGSSCVPLDDLGQGESYLDPEGPLKKVYRDGDSTWSLATPQELERAMERVREMVEAGTMEAYVRGRDSGRKRIGQTTTLFARK